MWQWLNGRVSAEQSVRILLPLSIFLILFIALVVIPTTARLSRTSSGSGSGGGAYIEVFLSDGDWIKPHGASVVQVTMVGEHNAMSQSFSASDLPDLIHVSLKDGTLTASSRTYMTLLGGTSRVVIIAQTRMAQQ